MNTFAAFLKNEDQDLYENFDWETFFESEEFENSQEYKEPVDGVWNSRQDAYYFNVPGDPCGECPCYDGSRFNDNKPRCYVVNISKTSSKGLNGISVSFKRGQGGYKDENKGVAIQVMGGVAHAMDDYISKNSPDFLTWSPIIGGGKIPEARKFIYNRWAAKTLFPDKYVNPDGGNTWYKREIYDEKMVPLGFPPIPENLNSKSARPEKREALNQLKSQYEKNLTQITQNLASEEERERERERQEIERERQEAERQRQEQEAARRREEEQRLARIQQVVDDPEKNPDALKVGDIVTLRLNSYGYYDSELKYRIARIKEFVIDETDNPFESGYGDVTLKFKLDFADYDDSTFRYTGPESLKRMGWNNWAGSYYHRNKTYPVTDFEKETEEKYSARNATRLESIKSAIDDPAKNPNNIQIGDRVITKVPNNLNYSGFTGVLNTFDLNSRTSLRARVIWDEGVNAPDSLIANISYVFKETPEMVADISRQKREIEVDAQVRRNLQRSERRTSSLRSNSSSEEMQALINDSSNPLKLKIGDHIVYAGYLSVPDRSRRWGPHKLIVTDLENWAWSGEGYRVYIQAKLFGSRSNKTYDIQARDQNISRDESPEAQASLARQQRQQQQIQQMQNATFRIGDSVEVLRGVHRGKTGRIVNITGLSSGGRATIAPLDLSQSNFTVAFSSLRKIEQTTESVTFKAFLGNVKC